MESIILIVHVLLALAVIGLVLLQHGKGADAGASFGAGASQTVFGSQGSGNFLTRTTAILATLFFVTSFALAVYAKQRAAEEVGLDIVEPALIEQRIPGDVEALPGEAEQEADLPVLEESPAAETVNSDLPTIDE